MDGLKRTLPLGWRWKRVERRKRVRFYTVSNLINDLQAAQRDLRIFKVTAWFTKLDLLVLDEVGYSPFREGEAQLLFQLCSQLYERVSIILATNLRFADWDIVFQESSTT